MGVGRGRATTFDPKGPQKYYVKCECRGGTLWKEDRD